MLFEDNLLKNLVAYHWHTIGCESVGVKFGELQLTLENLERMTLPKEDLILSIIK